MISSVSPLKPSRTWFEATPHQASNVELQVRKKSCVGLCPTALGLGREHNSRS